MIEYERLSSKGSVLHKLGRGKLYHVVKHTVVQQLTARLRLADLKQCNRADARRSEAHKFPACSGDL